MITNDQVAQVLEDAAELYESEKYDWCQGAYYNGSLNRGISMCASQALRIACGERFLSTSESTWFPKTSLLQLDVGLLGAAFRALSRALGSDSECINHEGVLVSWNDALGSPLIRRTKQEVVDLFKNTAKELRNGNQV